MVALEDGDDRTIEFLSRTQRCKLQLSLLEDICSFDRAKTEKSVDSDDILNAGLESCEWELIMAESDYSIYFSYALPCVQKQRDLLCVF